MVIPVVGVAIVESEQESALVGYRIGETYQMGSGSVDIGYGVSTSCGECLVLGGQQYIASLE